MKTLYANGCSYVYGDGCQDNPGLSDVVCERWSEYAWPKFLAERLNAACVNDAIGGGSNARIVRTTIDYVARCTEEERKDLLVIIGWTTIDRDEKYLTGFESYPDGWYRFNAAQQYVDYVIPPSSDRRVLEIEKYHKEHVRFYEPRGAAELFLHQVLSLRGFLESVGVKHLFFSSLPNIEWMSRTVREELNHLLKLLDVPQIIDLNSNIYDWIVANNLTPFSSCEHPLLPAHKGWAEHLHNELILRKIL